MVKEDFVRVTRCQPEGGGGRGKGKKGIISIIEIPEYPVAILRQGRGGPRLARSHEIGGKPWRIYKRTYRCSQQCVILLKHSETRDIGTLVGVVQMENETIIGTNGTV